MNDTNRMCDRILDDEKGPGYDCKDKLTWENFLAECHSYGYTTKDKKLAFIIECHWPVNQILGRRVSRETMIQWIHRVREAHKEIGEGVAI